MGFFGLATGALPPALSVAPTSLRESGVPEFVGDSTFIETRRGSIAAADPRRHPFEKKGQC
jgi:hypothetical protein